MDAKDLMIGDYFTLIDFNSPIRITAIYDDAVQLQENYKSEFDEEWYSEAYIKDLKPIPLTPEILEKNGFIGDKNVCKTKVRDDSEHELWQCEYAWYLKNLRIKNRTNGSVARLYNIMFVHELQHALRLCGINKEIEI